MTYEDSVQAITGRPAGGAHYAPSFLTKMFALNPTADGAYNPNIDTAVIQNYPDEPQRRDWVFAHEMGHRLDLRNLDPGMRQSFDSARAVNPAPGGYASVSRDEHFAEAFANAIQTLRQTAGDDAKVTPPIAHQMLQDAEGNIPGTMVLLKKLLANPMYRDHQLQQYRGMMALPYTALMQ
jgi:hypothetical protein